MAEPFLGEVRLMSYQFAPKGWAPCNGQLLPIASNQALYQLLGTAYGGDGHVNFGLPDLRGRTPIHAGEGHTLGEPGGEESHTVVSAEMPQHIHEVAASTAASGGTAQPNGNFLGGANNVYHSPNGATPVALRPETVDVIGGSQPHENMQPYLTMNFCIALQGVFPSAN